MLLESSYALGLVQTQPRDGNGRLPDSIVITDHNIFYSREPYDTGVPRASVRPRRPTATPARRSGTDEPRPTRGGGDHAQTRLEPGQLGAAELGHHLLAYDTRTSKGRGTVGSFLISRLENPNTLEAVLEG